MTRPSSVPVRLGVDIGGTFTDIALEIGDRYVTTKVLTTPARRKRRSCGTLPPRWPRPASLRQRWS